MKIIKLVIAFLFLISYSCSKSMENEMEDQSTLVGQWKLEKVCYSYGAGSCDEEDMWDAEEDEILTFAEDGSFSFNKEGEICTGIYFREDDYNVKLTASGGNCSFDKTIFSLRKLEINEMIFSPKCTEHCAHLYVRQ